MAPKSVTNVNLERCRILKPLLPTDWRPEPEEYVVILHNSISLRSMGTLTAGMVCIVRGYNQGFSGIDVIFTITTGMEIHRVADVSNLFPFKLIEEDKENNNER